MTMTLIAERVGLLVSFTRKLAQATRGDAKRLFTYLFFGISFLSDAKWMVLPATASSLVTYAALRWYFRNDLPNDFELSRRPRTETGAKNPGVCDPHWW